MQIGLFFGSFNPIHIGHLIIAEYMIHAAKADQIWFVVSPQNPFKKDAILLPENQRLEMVKIATSDNDKLQVCDIEFSLPKPSYTFDTLTILQEKYPEHTFSLIMGSDNLVYFEKWKMYEEILKKVTLHVYRRYDQYHEELEKNLHIKVHEAPVLHISATYVREQINQKNSIKYLVTDKVLEFMVLNSITN